MQYTLLCNVYYLVVVVGDVKTWKSRKISLSELKTCPHLLVGNFLKNVYLLSRVDRADMIDNGYR